MVAFLLSIVGVGNANAQASYNTKYTAGVDISDVTSSEYVFLYNIGSGQFLTNGMDYWGTHASVDHAGRDLTIASTTNGYSIYSKPYSINGGVYEVSEEKAGYMTLNGYIDTGTNDADWVFTPVTVPGYTNAYTINNYNNNSQYLVLNSSNLTTNVTENTNDAYSYWLIIRQSDRNAVSDYTYYLRNSDMICPEKQYIWVNLDNGNRSGGLTTNPCGEFIHKALDVNQTVTATLGNGMYKVYCQGFYRIDSGTDKAYLYANSNEQELLLLNSYGNSTTQDMAGASTDFSAGKYVNAVYTNVTGGSLTVGVKTAGAGNWVIFDNFAIEYLGSNTTVASVATSKALGTEFSADATDWYKIEITTSGLYSITANQPTALDYTTNGAQILTSITTTGVSSTILDLTAGTYYVRSKIDQAVTISDLPSGKMNSEVQTALNSAIITYNADKTSANLTALETAVSAATESISIYEGIKTYLDKLTADSQRGDISVATLQAMQFYTDYDDCVYENPTLDDIVAQYKSDVSSYWATNVAVGSNMTAMIVNNGFELDGTTTTNTAGSYWSLPGGHGNNDTGVREYTGVYVSTIDGTPSYANTALGDYIFNIYYLGRPVQQTISGLPNGTYRMSVLVGSGNNEADSNIFLTANGTHSDAFNFPKPSGSTLKELSFEFVVTDGTATIGVIGGNDDGTYNADGYWWYKADNFTLTYVSTDPLYAPELAEGHMYEGAYEAQQAALSTFNESKTWDNYNALVSAINAAEASIAVYEDVAIYLAQLTSDNQRGDVPVAALQAMEFYTKASNGTYTDTGTYTSASQIAPIYKRNIAAYWAAYAPSANADLTSFIVNQGFELQQKLVFTPHGGWDVVYGTFEQHRTVPTSAEGSYHITNSEGNYLYNNWTDQSMTVSISQSMSGLPNGTYTLTAVGASYAGYELVLTGNGLSSSVTCNTDAYTGEIMSVQFFVYDGTATISMSNTREVGNTFFKCDNFRLTYNADATFTPTLATGQMNTTIYNAQQTAISNWGNAQTGEKYNALVTAIDNAKASVAEYVKINDLLTKLTTKNNGGGVTLTNLNFYTKYSDGTSGTTGSYESVDEVIPQYKADVAAYWQTNAAANANMSAFILNNGFEMDATGGVPSYWELPKGTSEQTDVRSSDDNSVATTPEYTSDDLGNNIFNTWWQGKPIQQTITGLPNGTYKFSVLVATSDAEVDGKIFLQANGKHSDVITVAQGNSMNFMEYSFDFVVTDEEATISVLGGYTDGTYREDGYFWYKADNFTLTYLSSEATVAPDLAVGNMNGTVYDTMANAYTTWNTNKSIANYNTLVDAIAAAEESAAIYAKIADYANRLKTENQLGDIPTATYEASYVYNNLSNYDRDSDDTADTYTYDGTTYTLGTYTDEASFWTTYNNVVSTYWTDYVANNTVADGFDMTAFIVNQSFEFDGAVTNNPTGWVIDAAGSDASVREISNATYTMSNSEGTYLFNNWQNARTTLNIYQLLHGLPKGKYKLSAVVAGYDDGTTIDMSANSYNKKEKTPDGIEVGKTMELEFIVDNGNARISIENSGKGFTFFKCDNFKLTYLGIYAAIHDLAAKWDDEKDYVNVDKTDNSINDAFKIPNSAYTAVKTAAVAASKYSSEESQTKYNDNLTEFNTLVTAIDNFLNTTVLNGPIEGKQYSIKSTTNENAFWKDKYYITYEDGAQGYGKYSTGALWADSYSPNLSMTWKFERVVNPSTGDLEGNYYHMSTYGSDGNWYYLCTVYDGYSEEEAYGTSKLRLTSDVTKALTVQINHNTGVEDRYYLYNTRNNQYIGGRDEGFWTNNLNYDLEIKEHDPFEIELAAPGKFGVRTLPYRVAIPENVTAYYVAGYKYDVAETQNYELVLEEEEGDFKLAKPYLVYTSTAATTTPKVSGYGMMGPDIETIPTSIYPYNEEYDNGRDDFGLFGSLIETSVPASDSSYSRYGLQTKNGRQAFYMIKSDQTMPAYRAYLQVAASSGAPDRLGFSGDDATGIDMVEAAGSVNVLDELTSGRATVYDAAGAKQNGLQKGMNIVRTSDGKSHKIYVK
mgnify:CR=1 FL=1